MSSQPANGKEEDEIPAPQRPPSPPPHTTFAARGLHAPTFSAFRPRDIRIPSPQSMNHVAWNCDGRRLGAVGIDKAVRLWYPEKSMEMRSATLFSGGHTDDVDYLSWNPTHPDLFCTSSQKDRRIVFWDARQTRYIQQINLGAHGGLRPVMTSYAPDGRALVFATQARNFSFLLYGNGGDGGKEQWRLWDRDLVVGASTAIFNHAGDGVVLASQSDTYIRTYTFPSLSLIHAAPAHVGGCSAIALDPRGRYLASGGHDAIVNLFDLSEWIFARTITACDNAINALSFSHDGEFLAIANSGSYIDICSTETGMPLHRVPTLGPSPTVAWHPSKYIIAYCGQTKTREGGPGPSAWISLFGPGM
ncbi:WD40 repeat-like protein [Laetiporus sulphureus 93-53]|uniref:WD40 repeat-like protein n=1 Tax=Laetiporus sulphureus 93-53 TaxID=1314785 RepID=A0A165DU70_9APHY|nr:WD40 repeat-like protein [Laetiporus sulphureus 93-53]KZT05641.1 WD40 repeat-like protein [Laetiporus sulphureus 93-53]